MRRLLLGVVVILFAVSQITGCTGPKVKLDYIKIPDFFVIQGYSNIAEIRALMDQIDKIQKKGTTREEQDKVLQKIGDLSSKAT